MQRTLRSPRAMQIKMILRWSKFRAELERCVKVVYIRHMTQLLVDKFGEQALCMTTRPPLTRLM
jgi:hypothetical protein